MNIDWRWLVSGALIVVVLTTFVWAVANTTLLKDMSDAGVKPYSFSRVQLAWWTLIIAGCYIAAYGWWGRLDTLNAGCLVLLGIGAGTSAISKGVDTKQDSEVPHRHQDDESQGFLPDILSDDTGVSMHRFQALVFNVIYGVLFIHEFVTTPAGVHKLPDFDATQLGLLGISATTYLYMKSQENKTGAAAPVSPIAAALQTPTPEDPVVG